MPLPIVVGISSAISAIATAVASISGSVLGTVITLGTKLVPILGKVHMAIQVISTIVDVSAKLYNILKPQETIKDIGDRALQAEEQGITLESCNNNFEQYMTQLRSLELDPDKVHQHSDFERMAAGALIVDKGLELKDPALSTNILWGLVIQNPDFFNIDRMTSYLKSAKDDNVPFANSVSQFFSSEGTPIERYNASEFMLTAEQRFNPTATPNDVANTLHDVQEQLKREAR